MQSRSHQAQVEHPGKNIGADRNVVPQLQARSRRGQRRSLKYAANALRPSARMHKYLVISAGSAAQSHLPLDHTRHKATGMAIS